MSKPKLIVIGYNSPANNILLESVKIDLGKKYDIISGVSNSDGETTCNTIKEIQAQLPNSKIILLPGRSKKGLVEIPAASNLSFYNIYDYNELNLL